MNHKFLSGFTVALLIATLGDLPSYADQSGSVDESLTVKVSAESTSSSQEEPSSTQVAEANEAASSQPKVSQPRPDEALKVGEYQSQDLARPEEVITIIHPHQMAERQAATLYVRNIPVLTFLAPSASSVDADSRGNTPASGTDLKLSNQAADESRANGSSSEVKVASTQNSSLDDADTLQLASGAIAENAPSNPHDPVWRATEISARLNQFNQNSADASTINVIWDTQQQQYVIKAGDEVLVTMDANTILPNTTKNPTEDALQATNLIRRQMGNAPPIDQIPGRPEVASTLSLGSVQFTISGWASWYGPGFDGNYSASGEVFNENALTAAHPDLPFGTQVRVTNMDNGMSVVVRINDRGPYAGDRVIDLSRGAASVIGLVQSGVAPVSLEVLGAASASR
jgi:rare lipoprotein A